MRHSIRDFVKILSETLKVQEPIYEFGSLQVKGQEGFADLRPYFPGKKYVGCDMQEGTGVDLVADVCNLTLPNEIAGLVLSMDSLEHIEYLREAMSGMFRVLKPDGVLAISSVLNFAIHNYPNDFWRFTPEGFKSLLNIFPCSLVEFAGNPVFPHTVIGVGFKEKNPECLERLRASLCEWKKVWNGRAV